MRLVLLFCAAGCDGKWVALDDEGQHTGESADDVDGDGYTVGEGDCDDDDPAVNPAASEVCDDANVDEDCNGRADDLDDEATGRVVTYRDNDGDGVGAEGDVGRGWCDPPPGNDATVPDDCNDEDAQVYPSAEDASDGEGKDNDCDGFVDEDDLAPGDLLVTEMYWRGDDRLSEYVPVELWQWIEVYNNSSAVLDLGGWTLTLCHVGGTEVEAAVTSADCTEEDRTDVILPAGTRVAIGDWLVLCSDASQMASCDLEFAFQGPGMSVRHGYVELSIHGATFGPAATTEPSDMRLDGVGWWFIDYTDFWPNGASQSMRLADTEYQGADWDGVNDSYGAAGSEGPTWTVWCFPEEDQIFSLGGETRSGSPGSANGATCE